MCLYAVLNEFESALMNCTNIIMNIFQLIWNHSLLPNNYHVVEHSTIWIHA